MNVSNQAGKGHLIVGAGLVAIALGCAVASLIIEFKYFALLVFFFGVWGGVELGRYLEYTLTNQS